MRFKVAARTILELGAELISSDAIAIYELVKNAFDAGSKTAEVSFSIILKRSDYERIQATLNHDGFETISDVRAELERKFLDDDTGQLANEFMGYLKTKRMASLSKELESAYEKTNVIEIIDRGTGMSADTLESAFLTLGTPNRLLERNNPSTGRVILGEKGVGRLSSMRLGTQLEIITTEANAPTWNTLNIDWRDFEKNPDQMLEDVQLFLGKQRVKSNTRVKGTRLRISGLLSDWDKSKLKALAAGEFSRLMDPFAVAERGFPLELKFNGVEVSTEHISRQLFSAAHGYCKGKYTVQDEQCVLNAAFDYRLYNERHDFELGTDELRDAIEAQAPATALISLGSFKFEFYWFNRRLLKEIDGIGKIKVVRDLVNHWTGGLMLFRDGFRVNPYGGKNDDWLDLNSQAFRSSGYLLNTDQILGRIQISAATNPRLVDQTNREGLRDTFEKSALVRIMNHFLTVNLKLWMDEVNDSYKGLKGIDLGEVSKQVDSYEKRVNANIRELKQKLPEERELLGKTLDAFQELKVAFRKAQGVAEKAEVDRQRMIELAGIGLMVEIVAHELARATKHTLQLIRAPHGSLSPRLKATFDNLEVQVSTIDRRIRVLDVLSVSGRDRKSEFNLDELINDAVTSRATQLAEAGVQIVVSTVQNKPVQVKAVKGQVLQIIENLLANSLHWLAVVSESDRKFKPRISILVSREHSGSFTFTDNGPGISPRFSDEVFGAFFTTRQAQGGKGLGLYIARENARYHGGDLFLSDERTIHPDRLNTFIFRLDETP